MNELIGLWDQVILNRPINLHTYSRATNGPGKILSYTTKS